VLIWAVTGAVALVLAFAIFLFVSLLDEDVNHWDWPSDNGPGRAWNLRWIVLSITAAAALTYGPVILLRMLF